MLVEALPYIRRFWGKVVVIKYGGNALVRADGASKRRATGRARPRPWPRSPRTSCSCARSGMLPVVVHGGGPQIGELMARLGKVPEFRDGMRVTDAETLEIASMVLVGKVNREIVSAMNVHGSLAVGPVGRGRQHDHGHRPATRRSASSATSRWSTRRSSQRLLAEGLIPVVATIAGDTTGPGLQHQRRRRRRCHRGGARRREARLPHRRRRDCGPTPTIPLAAAQRDSVDELDAMVASGAASAGMIPKVEACARAVRAGVARRAHPRRPGPARAVARGLHRPGRGHDGLPRGRQCSDIDRRVLRPSSALDAHLRRAARDLRAGRGVGAVGHRRQAVPRLPLAAWR